jgi:PAS domain S-box-containing protein
MSMMIRERLAPYLSRTPLLFALLGAIFVAAIWGVTWHRVEAEREAAYAEEATKNSNLAIAHEEQVSRLLKLFDQILLTLRYDYALHGAPRDLNAYLAALQIDRRSVGIVALISSEGGVIATTAGNAEPNYADREYFRTHAVDDRDRLLIGKPVKGRISGKWIITLTRRLFKPDGSFGGVAFMAVDPDALAKHYRDTAMGPHASLALIGLDGITRLRRNNGQDSYGQDVHSSRLFSEIPKARHGHYVGIAASDGVRRTASYRVLEDFPLAVVVASSLDDVNAGLQGRKRANLAAAAIISVLAIALTVLAVRWRERHERDIRALRTSEQRYRSLVDWTPEPILVLREGHVLYCNAAALKVFGASVEGELMGKPVLDLIHPDGRGLALSRLADLANESHSAPMIEQKYLKLDGTAVDVEVQGIVIEYDGKSAQLLAIRDITERKSADRAIRAFSLELEDRVAARTAEIEAFMYSVSHDLRAPIRAIDGFAAMLRDELESHGESEGVRLLARIRNSAARMSALLDDLLELSRYSTQELHKESIDMRQKVASVLDELEFPNADATVEVGELPECAGDKVLVRQVWMNLIGNALKYSARQPQPLVRIGCENGVYYVRDNGIGFDQANVDKLFGLFSRLHHEKDYEGVGIGLAFVKRIVERHGGKVWAEGVPGEGAVFRFTLGAMHLP